MRNINEIIIHCASTYARMDIGAAEIREWHMRDNGWRDIGYHYVIRRNGTIEKGRPEEEVGAHCLNHNSHSIGICLVGGLLDDGKPGDNFLPVQLNSLEKLLLALKTRYPKATIHGHCEFADKACPAFDYKTFLKVRGLA